MTNAGNSRNPPGPDQSGSWGSEATGLLRAIDANTNRSMEALRVLEDLARFVFDDVHLTNELKSIRHELMSLTLPVADVALSSRDTTGDIGRDPRTDQEYERTHLVDLIRANARRMEQALRSLEECLKSISPATSVKVEQLRYRAYTLELALANTLASHRRLGNARLYVLIDGCESRDVLVHHVRMLVRKGVDLIQLRDKQLCDRELFERAVALSQTVRGTRTLAIVNDRPDIALAAQAHGVHVGQDELPVQQVRSMVGPDQLIGLSTHTLNQAKQAVLVGADYIGVGPVFPSKTKTFADFVGTELLAEVARHISLPAFAIGGINVDNLPLVRESGFSRVAISSAVTASSDPEASIQAIQKGLDEADDRRAELVALSNSAPRTSTPR